MWLLLVWTEAQAQQACINPMSRIQLGAALGEVTDALEASELVEARTQLDAISERLPCLEQVVDQELFALYARSNAIVHFYGQDEEQAARWGQASRLAAPELAWDENAYPPDNPIRTLIETTPLPAPETIGGGLAAPKGGGVFLNGHFAPRPEVWPDIPVLVQVFDRNRALVKGWWQEGSAFPADLLTSRAEDLPPPTWWTAEGPSSDKVKVDKVKPMPPRDGDGLPVVPLVAGAGLGLLSAASYLLAAQTASTFEDGGHSSEELTELRTRANLLVLASGASLAGAVGVGVGGVLISANGVTVSF
jgi:hypothetical protein